MSVIPLGRAETLRDRLSRSVDSAISSSSVRSGLLASTDDLEPSELPTFGGGGPHTGLLALAAHPTNLTSLRSSFLKSVHQIQTSNHSLDRSSPSLSFPLCKRVSLDFHPSHLPTRTGNHEPQINT